MKSKLLLILLVLITLAGCSGGGGSGSAQLEITRGFATGNASFDGGLYIHGKNSTNGDEFSFALAATQKASVTLSYGVWDIRAVGWDNDPDLFEGDALCANEKVNFTTDNQTLALQVTKAKCYSEAFASTAGISINSFFRELSPGVQELKTLVVHPCGALYDPANPTQLLTAADIAGGSFCSSYPKAFQYKPKGLTVTLHNKAPGNPTLEPGLVSTCMPATAVGDFFTNKRLPTRIPVTLTFYGEPDCLNSEEGVYYFPAGLDHALARTQIPFDSVIAPSSSGIKLGIASPVSKRGTSFLLTEMPLFRCNVSNTTDQGVPCMNLPPLPTVSAQTADFVLQYGPNTLKIPGGTCGNTFSGTNMTFTSCFNDTTAGAIYLSLDVAQNATPGNSSFTYGSAYNVYIKPEYVNVIKELMRIVGVGNTSGLENSLADSWGYDDKDDKDNREGIIGDVQEMFSPHIFGGMFLDQQCTTAPLPATVKRSLTFWEDGMEKNFMVILTNPPAHTVPGYIANTDNPRSLAGGNPFHRRFIIRDLFTFQTQMVMDIACDGTNVFSTVAGTNARIGRLEEFQYEVKTGKVRLEYRLMFWNTTYHHNARFERYQYEHEIQDSGEVSFWTDFTRGEKFAGTNSNDLKITNLKYNYHHMEFTADPNDDSWNEELSHTESDLSGLTTITHKKLAQMYVTRKGATPMSPGEIFTNGILDAEKEKIRYGTFIPAGNKVAELKVGPNSNYVWARPNDAAAKVIIDTFDGSNPPTTIEYSFAPQIIDVDMSFDGTKAIVAAANTSSGLNFWVLANGTWTPGSISPPPTGIMDLQASILNNGDILIVAKKGDQKLYLAMGNVSTLPSAINASSTHGIYADSMDQIQEFALVKTSSGGAPETFHLVMNRLNTTLNERSVTSCPFKISPVTCTLVHHKEVPYNATALVVDLSAHNSPDGSELSISFTDATPGSPMNILGHQTISSFDWGQNWSSPTLYDTPEWSINRMNAVHYVYDMSSVNNSGTYTPVMAPYVPPVVPGFQMNFNSLNPATMLNTVFTPDFEMIGAGL